MRDGVITRIRTPQGRLGRLLAGSVASATLALAAFAALAGSAAAQGGETVEATGELTKPQMTSYMYGTHAITDESTGTTYALRSETVDMYRHVGERVTVSGAVIPGYEEGALEGGPALVEVSNLERVESGGRGPDEGQYSGGDTDTSGDGAADLPPILPDTGGVGIGLAVLLAAGLVVGAFLLRRR